MQDQKSLGLVSVRVVRSFLVALILSIAAQPAHAEHEIKFSKYDRQTLKEIRAAEGLTSAAATLLLTAPVLTAIGGGDAVDVLVHLSTADWEKMATAAGLLKRLSACKVFEIIDAALDPGPADMIPRGEALIYFERVKEQASRVCQG